MDALTRQALKGVGEGEQVEKSEFITYLLTQKMLTPQEANSHVLDMMMGGVETVFTALFTETVFATLFNETVLLLYLLKQYLLLY